MEDNSIFDVSFIREHNDINNNAVITANNEFSNGEKTKVEANRKWTHREAVDKADGREETMGGGGREWRKGGEWIGGITGKSQTAVLRYRTIFSLKKFF
jgi:hypothetical protein